MDNGHKKTKKDFQFGQCRKQPHWGIAHTSLMIILSSSTSFFCPNSLLTVPGHLIHQPKMSRQQQHTRSNATSTQVDPAAKMAHPLATASLVQELEKHRETLASELQIYLLTSLETSLTAIRTSLDTIGTALDSHNQKITTIEDTLTNHSNELTKLTWKG